jgi:hypothetical protein
VNTWLLRCLVGGLVLATPALAQDEDAPYAYPDDEPAQQEEEEKPRRSRYADPGEEFKEAAEQEDDEEQSFQRMYRLDDPNTGLAGELIAGALLLDSSRGAFAETMLGVGLRFTWEYGRLLDSVTLRDALWADVRWTWGALNNGTELISSQTNVHYFTLAPAYELRLSNALGVYAQVGGGAAYHATSLSVGDQETVVNGLKPVIQYGVGLRGRPRLSDTLSLAFRVEVTRFRRGYMDDTFIGGSIGTAF